jgi:hypothetical protein
MASWGSIMAAQVCFMLKSVYVLHELILKKPKGSSGVLVPISKSSYQSLFALESLSAAMEMCSCVSECTVGSDKKNKRYA